MKITNTIILALSLTFGMYSCKEEGCIDPQAENYDSNAEKDDNSCTYLSDKLVGTYTVSQDCAYSGSDNYSMTVIEGGNKSEIILQNLNNSVDVKATISGTNFTFKEDKAGITYEGSGYMNGSNGMTINMEICETYYYPCSDPDACSLSCTK